MSPERSDRPGPEEEEELLREERHEVRDQISERAEAESAEEDTGEETLDEFLEVDQTELEELGLTLDDPERLEQSE